MDKSATWNESLRAKQNINFCQARNQNHVLIEVRIRWKLVDSSNTGKSSSTEHKSLNNYHYAWLYERTRISVSLDDCVYIRELNRLSCEFIIHPRARALFAFKFNAEHLTAELSRGAEIFEDLSVRGARLRDILLASVRIWKYHGIIAANVVCEIMVGTMSNICSSNEGNVLRNTFLSSSTDNLSKNSEPRQCNPYKISRDYFKQPLLVHTNSKTPWRSSSKLVKLPARPLQVWP